MKNLDYFPFFLLLYSILTIIFMLITGEFKKSKRRIWYRFISNFCFGVIFSSIQFSLAFLYPQLQDSIFRNYSIQIIIIFLFIICGFSTIIKIQIDEIITEDRINDLIKLGWRKIRQSDYESFDEYFSNMSYNLYHPDYGIKFLTKAEKIEGI